jgi:hypothetical protein
MKTFTCALLLVAVAAAEPPRFRLARFRSARQELSEGDEKQTKTEDSPYPAAGFKPETEFNLPAREEASPPATSYGTPDSSYGAPFKTFSAPQAEYGPPEAKKAGETEKPEKEKKVEKGVASEAESLNETKKETKEVKETKEKKEKLQAEPKNDAEVLTAQGAYYVLLPGSQLQRVQFQTENDISNMAYTARLQYKNEDRAPLFVYTALPQFQSAAYVQLI